MMSYLKRWRKINRDIALADSDNEFVPQFTDSSAEESIHIQSNVSNSDLDGNYASTQESNVSNSNPIPNVNYESSDSEAGLPKDVDDLAANEPTFEQSLASFYVQYNLPREAGNKLLNIMRQQGYRLPADIRTLIKTPRVCIVENKCGGDYAYYGIETGVIKILAQNPDYCANNDKISLQINIDGLPIFKSTTDQMWPILCAFEMFPPFIVALFSGKCKPNNVADYLSDFLNEVQELKQRNIRYNNNTFIILIKVFICDAPARSFLKCVKQHNSYYGCERCIMHGEFEGRVVYNNKDVEIVLRTDVEFAALAYNVHQITRSPLIDIGVDCVKNFALDYMHLVCLGVVKRMISFVKTGPRECACRLSARHIEEISGYLEEFRGNMPSAFARQPRSLKEVDRWKATEFRQFLLYTGPVALKPVFSEELYKHFMSLSVAITILLTSSNVTRNHYLPYSRQLLKYFVDKCQDYYGKTFTVYNVHSLLHLPDDAEHFQSSLNDISSFKFENHLQYIKKMLKSAHNPIAQVTKRIQEAENTGRLVSSVPRACAISTNCKDSCFLLANNDYAFVKERRPDGHFVCDVIKFEHTENFYTSPCNSKILNIVYTSEQNLRRRKRRKLIERHDLQHKVVNLPHNDGYVLFPVLHGAEI